MGKKLKQYEIEVKDRMEVDAMTKDVKKHLQEVKIEEVKMKGMNVDPKEERRLSLRREFLQDAQHSI